MAQITIAERAIDLPVAGGHLLGSLAVPVSPRALVCFAQPISSTRGKWRNRELAESLHGERIATLVLDLLTGAESPERQHAADIDLLTRRLLLVTSWVRRVPQVRGLPLGYVGIGTGAAAALRAAAGLGGMVAAVVCHSGRPDLIDDALLDVLAPTLLVVGGDDWTIADLNEQAETLLGGVHGLEIVFGTGREFEEPPATAELARLTRDWFRRHLVPVGGGSALTATPTTRRRSAVRGVRGGTSR